MGALFDVLSFCEVKMSYRSKARRLATNNREYKNFSMDGLGLCKWCPPHHGDNDRGSRSRWGKKVAARTMYVTGKKRKELPKYMRKWYDKHYDEDEFVSNRRLDNKYYEIDKGDLALSLDGLGDYLKKNRNRFSQQILGKVDNPYSSGTIYAENEKLSFTIYVARKRIKTSN